MSISVVILSLNEEANLPGALESLRGLCDDVVVFDSHSTDRTTEIAVAAHARVVTRTFDNYAAQRNAAINDVKYKHPWLFMLDADERVDPALWQEMTALVCSAPANLAIARMRRKDYFMGRWLRRSSGYPTWFGRLMKIGRVKVEREINEEYVADGDIVFLSGHLIHYPFNRGIAHWIDRHNRYSTAEAKTLLCELKNNWSPAELFASDPPSRRRAMKQLAYRLPMRPLLAFCYLYIARLGFLDGLAGYRFCRMRAMYEYMIDLKFAELRAPRIRS
jgi:glycosyltransferase involved in cell wall biosynthesis